MENDIQQKLENEAYNEKFKEIAEGTMKPSKEWNTKEFSKFLEIIELEKGEKKKMVFFN